MSRKLTFAICNLVPAMGQLKSPAKVSFEAVSLTLLWIADWWFGISTVGP